MVQGFDLLQLKHEAESFIRDKNLLLNQAQLIQVWQQDKKARGIDFSAYKSNLSERLNKSKLKLINKLGFFYKKFDQSFWENQTVKLISFEHLDVNDINLTQQQLSNYALKLETHSKELANFLNLISNILPEDTIKSRSDKLNFQENLTHIKSHLAKIHKKLSDTRQRIDNLQQEFKKEQEAKSLGIGEKVTLPDPCVIVYMFYTEQQNTIFSVRSGGHLAIEIIHGNDRLYFSAAPGKEEIPQDSSLRNNLNAALQQTRLPRDINKKGKFNSKDDDLYFLNHALPPRRYERCQAVILDCSGEQPKIPLDIQIMLDIGKGRKEDNYEYNFWKKNCADMAMDLLRVGGIDKVAKQYGLQSPPKTFGITVPLESFEFIHKLASRSEQQLNQEKTVTVQEQWRYRFGQARSNLLLAMDISTFTSPDNEIPKGQQYLKGLYQYFSALEEKITSPQYFEIDKLAEFLKNIYAECNEKNDLLIRMLSQSNIKEQERYCYEQAISVLKEISTKFNDHAFQFLKQNAKELISSDLISMVNKSFNHMRKHNYHDSLQNQFRGLIKESKVENNEYDEFLLRNWDNPSNATHNMTDEQILLKCLGWPSFNEEEMDAYRYLIENVQPDNEFKTLLNIMQQVNEVLLKTSTLSSYEENDPKAILLMRRNEIIDFMKKIYNLGNQKNQIISQEFCNELIIKLQKVVGKINHEIFFNPEPSSASKMNSDFFTQVQSRILPSKNIQDPVSITNYADLRTEFIKSLPQKQYTTAIAHNFAAQLITRENSGNEIIIPPVWKFWRRTERKELLELKAIKSLIELLNQQKTIRPQDFDGIRSEFLQEHKGRIFLVQTFDLFVAGKISEEKLIELLKIYESHYVPNSEKKSAKLSEKFQALYDKTLNLKTFSSEYIQSSDKKANKGKNTTSNAENSDKSKTGQPKPAMVNSSLPDIPKKFAFLFHSKHNAQGITAKDQVQPGFQPNR